VDTAGTRIAERPRQPPWIVLSLGFGGLLIFILAGAWSSFVVLGRVQGDETGIRVSFLNRLQALDRIRSQIYLSGTYVRDFLLSPDAQGAGAQAARLTALRQESKAALENYAHGLEAEEREPFQELQNEIDSYWHVLESTLSWTQAQRDRLRYGFFYEELVPRRTAMLQIADRITSVNERGLSRAEERLAASSEGLRNSLRMTFGITFLGGLLLALITIRSTLRLEHELESRLAENARARADLRDLSARLVRAQEIERRNLARELHDEVGQSLTAILMEADGLEPGEAPGRVRDRLASIRSLAEKTVNQLRDIALLLRPSMLDDFGLVPALNWHAREVGKRSGIKVLVSADDGANDLSDEHKTCIYRLVQEAMSNAARHSGARTIEVRVLHREQEVVCEVQDDGRGFDPVHTRGMGLLGMEERIARLGGSFRVASGPGRGATIEAKLPLIALAARNGDATANHHC
jgi:signal transduction histidine kinase